MSAVETTNPTIERAIDVVTTEIEITVDEREALSTFASRLRDVDTTETGSARKSDPLRGPVLSITDRQESGSRERTPMQREVIDAYRETVVQMDHYEAEYGNPIPADIALEFGEQAAHLVFLKTDLTATDLRNLLGRAKQSLRERKQYRRGLERELDSLERCDTDLGDIEARFFDCPAPADSSFGDLSALYADLSGLEQRCQDLITRRQDLLHSRPNANLRGVDGQSLNRYLYEQRVSVTCPVLHDAVSLFQNVRTQREDCEERLADVDGVGDRSPGALNG